VKYNFITIEGCIGAGKTTFASRIANDFNGKLILERFEDNPFLPSFYNDPERHAFSVELYFMAERFQYLNKLLGQADMFKAFTVSDFLFQKSFIFAMNNLKDDEAKLYRMLFDIINPNLPKPEIVLYLYADIAKLLSNIKKRGREYEQQIKGEYLEGIQSAYLDFFRKQEGMRIVIVNATNLNIVESNNDYQYLCEVLNTEFTTGVHYV
jgi:deoxyguanosine kinase